MRQFKIYLERRNAETRVPAFARVVASRLLFAMLLLLGISSPAQTNFFSFSLADGAVQLTFQTNDTNYYVLFGTADLQSKFAPLMIAFGSNAPVYQTLATNSQQFFDALAISIYSPEETLGDGIDDVFKLENGLNPLDRTLATNFSGHVDLNGNPLTWHQYYLQEFCAKIPSGEGYSRELGVFNSGQPAATYEAFGREVSIYNGQSLPLTAIPEAYSREVSVFNTSLPTANYEAIAREVSIYNGQALPPVVAPQEAYSREVSVFAFAPSYGSADTISREVSVFNTPPPTAALETISREVSIFNNGN